MSRAKKFSILLLVALGSVACSDEPTRALNAAKGPVLVERVGSANRCTEDRERVIDVFEWQGSVAYICINGTLYRFTQQEPSK